MFKLPTVLHAVSASIMFWGYLQLDNLVTDAWLKEQKGGHWRYLTVFSLAAACLSMLLGLGYDLFPSVEGFHKVRRLLLMIALPLSVVVAAIYGTLLLFFPVLILPPVSGSASEPTSSSAAPSLQRIPVSVDLTLHALPVVALVTDFMTFQIPYSSYETRNKPIVLSVLSGVGYASWTEYCASYDGNFPYPFLAENPLGIRIIIYAGTTLTAWLTFKALNRLHPQQ